MLEERQERATFSGRARPSIASGRPSSRPSPPSPSGSASRSTSRTDYQHVEGTSFAAPITASVAAQMLELDPKLTPALVREGLVSTAKPIEGVPRRCRARACLQPRAAVRWVEERLAARRET